MDKEGKHLRAFLDFEYLIVLDLLQRKDLLWDLLCLAEGFTSRSEGTD